MKTNNEIKSNSSVFEITLDEMIEQSIENQSDRLSVSNSGLNTHFPISSRLIFDNNLKQFFISNPFALKQNVNERIHVSHTLIPVSPEDDNSSVLVMFDNGDVTKPIIVGKIETIGAGVGDQNSVNIPEKLIFSAGKEIVLQSGKSSITLTKSGKVLIKGKYILSRSEGVNKIRGGSIQLN